ncbi:MAG: GGDEF domain-containing protein, partial [Gemmatimonadales bacterium]
MALAGAIFYANTHTSAEIRIGTLYLLPVLLATWYEGWVWGAVFTAGSIALRSVVAADQMPVDTTATERIVTEGSYVAVAAGFIVFLHSLRGAHAKLRELATTDQLTRTLNARAFADRLGQELQRSRRYARPVAVVYLDLDDFKLVNDRHGHEKGNIVLRLVADAIRTAVRPVDSVGRLGGDEFGILMPETDPPGARTAAERLAAGIAGAFRGNPSVTASVGVVACSKTDVSADEVLHRAD